MSSIDRSAPHLPARSLVADTLCEQLLARFEDPGYEPPLLPSVALELISLSAEPDVDAAAVVDVLERDEVLAAKVFRLVSSPLYAGRAKVQTLHEAVVRLGINLVRDAVFEASVKQQVFDRGEYRETLEQLRRHSTVTAYLSRLICRHTGSDPNYAFICGLLHDIGVAALLLAIGDAQEEAPPLASVWRDIDLVHQQAAEIVTRIWKLPRDIYEVVAHHHHLHTGPCAPVAHVVTLADDLSRSFGADLVGPPDAHGIPMPADQSDEFVLETCREQLGLAPDEYALVVERAEKLVPEILWL